MSTNLLPALELIFKMDGRCSLPQNESSVASKILRQSEGRGIHRLRKEFDKLHHSRQTAMSNRRRKSNNTKEIVAEDIHPVSASAIMGRR